MSTVTNAETLQIRSTTIVLKATLCMMPKKISQYLARTRFVQKIMEHPADLSEFRERPTLRLVTGLLLMALSFLMGWPAIFVLSILAVRLQEPWIAVIGCPAAYALSCVVFIIGAWLARAPHYLNTLTKYAFQHVLKKML